MCHLVWDVEKCPGQLQEEDRMEPRAAWMQSVCDGSWWHQLCAILQALLGSSCSVRARECRAEGAEGAHPHHPFRLGTHYVPTPHPHCSWANSGTGEVPADGTQ